ncbi:autophagy-related protein 2 homolog B isoform X1 [Octopus sinensis]|uniref:Autophagy-related protein 2 n=1 Tax=Octopus sinensis TaxID=2607531 RepID=A0A6P7S8B5_9MOLL|nr:autophagy-related protein 2 homolog B isoform X1 [Octopus sinensis]
MSTTWISGLFTEQTKLKACRYLLHHYLGELLKDNVSLEQLSVDIFKGKGTIEHLSLDEEFINQWLKTYSVPVELVSSVIDEITVSIPWSTLLGSSTLFEVHGLKLELRPKCRSENGPSFEEMVSSITSMTSSLQMAEEMLRNEKISEENTKYNGANTFADTIDSVLSRVKISVHDISICLDHILKDSGNQKARLEMRIQRMDFFDDMAVNESVATDPSSGRKKWEPSAIACKNFKLSGVTFHIEECVVHPDDLYNTSHSSSSDSSTQLFESAHNSPPLCKSSSLNSPDVLTQQPLSLNAITSSGIPSVHVAALSGITEVKMKMKQNEAVAGPKLEVDLQVGSLDILMGPRQVHVLLEILSCFTSSASSEYSPSRLSATTNKPMKQTDYLRVEHQLQNHLLSNRLMPHLTNMSDAPEEVLISSHGPDDFVSGDEMYYSLKASNKSVTIGSDMESSFSSNTSEKSTSTVSNASTGRPRSGYSQNIKDPTQKLLDDPSVELSKFRIKLSSLTMTILHENPAVSPGATNEPFDKFTSLSTNFFSKIRTVLGDTFHNNMKDIRSKISIACPYDHLGLICRSIVLDSSQKSSSNHHSMALDCSIVLMDVVECLFDRGNSTASLHGFTLPIDHKLPEYCELLTFAKHSPPNMSSKSMYNSFHYQNPALKLSAVSVNRTKFSQQRSTIPKTELSFELGQFTSEVDITIVDRINSLLKSDLVRPPDQNINSGLRFVPTSPYASFTTQALYEGSTTEENRVSLKVGSSSCILRVRFPIPDLRSEPQVDRLPWWKRNLRQEVLVLKLNGASFHTILNSNDSRKIYELKCHSLNGSLEESPESAPVHFITVEPEDESAHSYGFNWPRMVITQTQELNSLLEEENNESDESTNFDSLNGACQFKKPEPSPFSTKKFMYHKEEVSDKSEVKNVSEELILPGDKEELKEFQDKTSANSCLLFEITVPSGNVTFPDKQFYELLYNRISNDLLLWEPTAPFPLSTQEQSLLPGQTLDNTFRVQYLHPDYMSEPRSSTMDSESDSDESQNMSSFPSLGQRNFHSKQNTERQLQSKLSLVLNISKCKVHVTSQIPQDVTNETNCNSELSITAKDAILFMVVNYNSDPDLQFICFQSNKIDLFHSPPVESNQSQFMSTSPQMTSSTEKKPSSVSDLLPTIFKSEFTFDKSSRPVGCGPDSLDMLSIAVKVKLDNKMDTFNYPAMKEFTIAIGVQGATLKHRMTPSEESWFSQALDFLNVADFPINGYVQPKILTQLHVHLWNCAVDYRPINLPIHTLLHTKWLSLSSNIFAESMSTMLRFEFDRTGLFISQKAEENVTSLKDYVCVADWDRFELSLRTSGGKETKIPKKDVTITSNRFNVRTCSDSCVALMELIQYIANDGDLQENFDDSLSSTSKSNTEDLDDSIHRTTADNGDINPTDLVHDMMEDAMKESTVPEQSKASHGSHSKKSSSSKRTTTEVFFVPPNEDQPLYPTSHENAANLVSTENLSSSSSSKSLYSSSMSEENTELDIDEDYCILDDIGMGVEPRDNRPEIKVHIKEPLTLKENFFYQPLGRTDALKSPEHFPVPETRYTLKEMSIHWYMYAGSDFGPAKRNCDKNQRAHGCDSSRNLHNYRSDQSDYYKKIHKERNVSVSLYDLGGPGRETDIMMELQLMKVRMQHETYPPNCEQVSRQVLLINEVEVLDRLASSPYNKFLYQYTSESTPKQTYASMLLIKALHTCPDPAVPAEECALKISVQPIKLNIDQDALFFLMKFMSEIMNGSSSIDHLKSRKSPEHELKAESSRRRSSSNAPLPILSTNIQGPPASSEEDDKQQEMLIKFDIRESIDLSSESSGSAPSENKENRTMSQPTYFRSVIFSPDLPIRLDYNGKRVDMEQGTIAGLLVGLAQLNCSELNLRAINYRHGLLGIQRVLVSMLTDWLDDIKKNQIPRILGGVGPIHSVVQLIQGIKDLFWLPIEQYRRDGRIVRGLQRGASSFTTSTAMAMLELTNRLVKSIQYLAMLTYDMVSPGPSVCSTSRKKNRIQKRSKQPNDLREGMTNAYIVLRQGFSETAESIVRAATEEHEHKGMTGAVGGVIRQIPPTMVQPIILASEATSNVLGGMRNQLVPDARREDVEKWKVPTS